MTIRLLLQIYGYWFYIRIIYSQSVSRCIWKFLLYWMSSNYLARSIYCSNGPNDLCHCDGYYQIKQYGFPIHGGVDGFSGKILWLKVVKIKQQSYRSSDFIFKCDKRVGFMRKSVKNRLCVWKWWHSSNQHCVFQCSYEQS